MKKVVFKWTNGITKEIEVNCNSEKIIAISEIKHWCDENNFKYPKIFII